MLVQLRHHLADGAVCDADFGEKIGTGCPCGIEIASGGATPRRKAVSTSLIGWIDGKGP